MSRLTNLARPHYSKKGTDNNDDIKGTDRMDSIHAGKGDDKVDGGKGHDLIDGGDGNDSLIGGEGNDVIYGGKGNDLINGGDGNDRLIGGEGDDMIYSGSGRDWIHAGKGDDIINLGTGSKFVKTGDGEDIISINGTVAAGSKDMPKGTVFINDFDVKEDVLSIGRVANPEKNIMVTQYGRDTVISFRDNPDYKVVLQGVKAKDLSFGDTSSGKGGDNIQVDGVSSSWTPKISNHHFTWKGHFKQISPTDKTTNGTDPDTDPTTPTKTFKPSGETKTNNKDVDIDKLLGNKIDFDSKDVVHNDSFVKTALITNGQGGDSVPKFDMSEIHLDMANDVIDFAHLDHGGDDAHA